MDSMWEPDVVIGIDFGTTCTGVAYSTGPEWPEPKCIQRWPNRFSGSDLANKVPSQVSYSLDGNHLRNWGFFCDFTDLDTQVEAFFKLYLNPDFTDSYPDRPTHAKAQKFFQDYIACIHNYMEEHFSNTIPRWAERKIEYLFSIPTNWRNPALSAEIIAIVKSAGFGRNKHHCRVKISLTEAEAAAVCAAKQHFNKNDVVLVCDAGGGTTDINILKVTESTWTTTALRALNVAEGINAGSALIDMAMEKFIVERLSSVPALGSIDVSHGIAQSMLRDQFQRFKHAFGSEGADFPALRLPVPGLEGKSFAALGISYGVMSITIEKVQEIFDQQVKEIFTALDRQLHQLERDHPTEHISYLVLSGGLGCSPYIRKKVKSRYETSPPTTFNARQMKLLYAPEPQLAVVQGLVMDRTQQIFRGTGIYQDRCCRVSYGVVCREPYNEMRHRGERVSEDPLDKTRWAEDQIDWLIKQGVRVPDAGVSRPYQLKIPLDKMSEIWKAQIVMSTALPDRLPRSLRHDDVRRVCIVDATFDTASFRRDGRRSGTKAVFQRKNSHFWQKGHEHILANFDVKVLIGAADLKFKLQSKDGQNFGLEHPEIEVTWEQASSASGPGQNMGQLFRKKQRAAKIE